MKKILLTIALALTLMVSHAQESSTVYQAYNSSWYVWENDEWVLQTENKDVDISMVFYKNSINIQAKTPTLYKLRTETKKTINEKNIYGQSFEALECVNEYNATVSYIYFRDDNKAFLLSIIFKKDGRSVNFRYYSTLHNN